MGKVAGFTRILSAHLLCTVPFFVPSDAMSTVFKRLPIGGAISVFKAGKTYRPGSSEVSAAITAVPLSKALATAKTKVTFLEAETLKGLPVNSELSMKTIDPYLACYIKDVYSAYYE